MNGSLECEYRCYDIFEGKIKDYKKALNEEGEARPSRPERPSFERKPDRSSRPNFLPTAWIVPPAVLLPRMLRTTTSGHLLFPANAISAMTVQMAVRLVGILSANVLSRDILRMTRSLAVRKSSVTVRLRNHSKEEERMILRINILGVLCALALINPLSMMGQDKQFTLHDLIPGGKTQSRFVPRNLKQLQWCGDTYLYVKGDSMMSGESTKAVKVAFTRQQLNEALAVAGAQSVGGMPFFSVPYKDQPVLAFNAKHHRFHYDFVENRIVSMYDLNGSWENFDFCPANGYLAFTEEDNLKILSPDNAVSIVTDETAEGVVCGKSVHQNEFGIHKGTFWSPNGSARLFTGWMKAW